MNPSNAKSSGLSFRESSTPEHDELQLWLFNKENRTQLIQTVLGDKIGKNEKINTTKKAIEFPIYGHNRFILGIIDCLLNIETKDATRLIEEDYYQYENGIEKRKTRLVPRTEYYNILIEIKPRLNSISSLLSQIKIYNEYVRRLDCNRSFEVKEIGAPFENAGSNIMSLVLTTDENTDFDDLLKEENIYVYRVHIETEEEREAADFKKMQQEFKTRNNQ